MNSKFLISTGSTLVLLAMFFGISHVQAAGLSEGLLVEAQVTQGASAIAGRVLIEAGRSEWTTIAGENSGKSKKSTSLKLEARAVLLEPDVVEVETRVTGASGGHEQTGKLIVRLGESATITTSQMESGDVNSSAGSGSGVASSPKETSIGVKVLRVRYSL